MGHLGKFFAGSKLFVSLFIYLGLALTSLKAYSYDPSIEWRVLRSAHFELIYDEKYKEQAQIFLNAGETSYKALTTVFSEAQEKTIILVTDQTDQSNGFASYLPYPSIVVYPVMPDSLSELSSYDDWALELIMHEYTHILSMKPSHGFYTPLRWIFGTVIRPNAILPRWYLEGVAVEMESRFTLHGRLRNPQTSASLRALVEDGRLGTESIDRINESGIPTYPYGSRPYLFGSLLWKYITDEKGVGAVDQLHQRYSRRLPFLLNGPLEDILGVNYNEALNQMYAQVRTTAEAQIKSIRTASQDPARKSEHKSLNQHTPAISPDARKLLFLSSQPYEGGFLWLAEKTSPTQSFNKAEAKPLFRIKGSTGTAWLPDSKSFVFDQIGVWDRHYYFRDLYHYNFDSKKTERLTNGERTSDVAISPDGKTLAYIRADGSRTELKVFDLGTRQSRVIFAPPLFVRLSRPTFLDKDSLLVSMRSRQGSQGLYRFSLNGTYLIDANTKTASDSRQSPEALFEKFPEAGQARMTPRGLIFTSTQNGTSNLYLANKELTDAKPLSNTTTSVLNADLDSKTLELWSSRLTSQGPKLFVTPKPRYLNPPMIEPLVSVAKDWQAQHLVVEEVQAEEKSYWPLKYMLPRYWIPFIYPVEGGMLFQGSTTTQDPAGTNAYALQGGYDTVTKKGSYGFSYLNQSTPVGIQLTASEFQDYLGSSDLTVTQRFQSLGFNHYLPGLSEKFHSQLFGTNAETEVPVATATRTIYRQGVGLGLNYADFDQDAGSGLYADGNLVKFEFTHYLSGGKLTSYNKYELSLAHRFKAWLPARHSLLTQLKGSHAPEMNLSRDVIALGDKTIGGNYLASLINSPYLMRGYPSGAFTGRSLANVNVEYTFPVADIFKGPGLFPWFFNSLDAAIFADGVSVDGAIYNYQVEAYRLSEIEDSYWSSGLEFRLNTTAAYHLPLDITFGLYYGFDERAGGDFTTFLSLGYTPHEGIGFNKSPALQ